MQEEKIENFTSDKIFQMWDALVSHKHFLLRCAASALNSENTDIIFIYVTYLEIPTTLYGLEIAETRDSFLLDKFARRTGKIFDNAHRLFEIKSGGKEFYVIASQVLIDTNTLGTWESPLKAILGIPEKERKEYLLKLKSSFYM